MNFEKKIGEADAVVFDLGAVILNIDPQLSIYQFEKLGVPDFFSFLFGHEEHGFFEDFERGKYSPQQFREHVRQATGAEMDDQQFDSAFNAMLLDYPHARIDAVLRCSKTRPTYLLSNTNEIHYQHYSHRIGHAGIECLDDMFRAAFFSHRMGMRKPDAEIFEELARRIGVPARKILFLDDNLKNIEAADRLGIATVRVAGGIDIAQIF